MNWKIILLLIVASVIFINTIRSDFLIEETAPGCDVSFLVLDGPKSKEAALILCQVNKRLKTFMNYLKMYPQPGTDRLLERYSDLKIVESSDSAYTINKSLGYFDKIHLCLKRQGRFFDIDTIMFVVIHELTHVMRDSLDLFNDHPRGFWRDNRMLLLEAEKAGVMKNINYGLSPVQYCEKKIASNPVFMGDM